MGHALSDFSVLCLSPNYRAIENGRGVVATGHARGEDSVQSSPLLGEMIGG
jgi:hypothetical protein